MIELGLIEALKPFLGAGITTILLIAILLMRLFPNNRIACILNGTDNTKDIKEDVIVLKEKVVEQGGQISTLITTTDAHNKTTEQIGRDLAYIKGQLEGMTRK